MNKTVSAIDLARGYSDLAMFIAGLLALLIILSIKPKDKQVKKNWILTFLMITISSGLGFFQHTYDLSILATKIIWIFLYFSMFEVCRRYTATLMSLSMRDNPNVGYATKALFVMEIIFYVFTTLMQLISPIHMIGLFMVFAAITTIKSLGAVAHLKRDKVAGSNLLVVSMVFLALAVVLQITRGIGFVFVGWMDFTTLAHVFITLALFFVCAAAVRTIKTVVLISNEDSLCCDLETA